MIQLPRALRSQFSFPYISIPLLLPTMTLARYRRRVTAPECRVHHEQVSLVCLHQSQQAVARLATRCQTQCSPFFCVLQSNHICPLEDDMPVVIPKISFAVGKHTNQVNFFREQHCWHWRATPLLASLLAWSLLCPRRLP